MPKLQSLAPPAWGALELTPFALNFAFVPYREEYFRSGPANILLAESNNRKVPVFPTLPAMFNGTNYLTEANYVPGARNAALQSSSATRGRIWVTSKKPWLRQGWLPRVPRTVVVSGAAVWNGSMTAPGLALDAAWGAFDEGGWEVAALGLTDEPYWGLPVLDTDISAVGLSGDFAGYFGELVLCRIGRADVTVVPFDYIQVGTDLDLPPPADPTPDVGEVNYAQQRYTVPVEHTGPRAAITSVANSGGARVTTTTTDSLQEEELIRVTGTTSYNGEFKVISVTATQFTLADKDSLAPIAFVADETGFWRRRTSHRLVWVRYRPALLDSGPEFYGQVQAHYKRFRHVVVSGTLADFSMTETDPTTLEWDLQNNYEAVRRAELLLSPTTAATLYTGLSATHLSVPFLPLATFDERAVQALATWLSANLNS